MMDYHLADSAPADKNPVSTTPPIAFQSPPARHTRFRLAVLLALASFLFILPGFVERMRFAWTHGQQRAELENARVALASPESLADAFKLVARNVGPSVVHIDTSRTTQHTPAELRKWFGPGHSFEEFGQGQGAGVVVSQDGYILTNFHVVEGANAVTIHLGDGRVFDDVQVVGVDAATDLVVLKVEADGLLPAEWGDSDQLSVGDWVLAVGSPYGLDHSVTAGILSAKNRNVNAGHQKYDDLLQTDAAVNPGNSGGPLVDIQGRVVGINTAIVGQSYGGISFALPSKTVRHVYEQLRANPIGDQGLLGVQPQDVSAEIAGLLGVVADRGAIIAEVLPDSPARRAGIEPYDVVLTWDGHTVAGADELRAHVAATDVGRRVAVEIVRGGRTLTLTVEVGRRPTTF